MSYASLLPDFALEHALDDLAFAAAYDVVSVQRRAWLKKCIARLHVWHGEERTTGLERVATWRQGFVSEERLEPLPWAMVTLDPGVLSPVRCLAAVLPPLLAGVGQTLVVRVHADKDEQDQRPWPARLLTAFELAGQEFVLDLTAAQTAKLARTLAVLTGPGLIVCLEESRDSARPALAWLSDEARKAGVAVWRPRWDGRIGIWAPDGAAWDWDTLHWAHPDAVTTVWGNRTEALPSGFTARKGKMSSFLKEAYTAAFVPSDAQAEALDRVPLVLGPGHEGCWLWPDLTLGLCRRRSVAWTAPVDADAEGLRDHE